MFITLDKHSSRILGDSFGSGSSAGLCKQIGFRYPFVYLSAKGTGSRERSEPAEFSVGVRVGLDHKRGHILGLHSLRSAVFHIFK